MITNTGYTGRAMQVAQDEGISLLIVRPNFDARGLRSTRRNRILKRIETLAQTCPPVYHYEVSHKACGMVSPSDRAWLHAVEQFYRAPAEMDAESRLRDGIPLDLRDIPPPPVHTFLGSQREIGRAK